ncbi:ComEA family DNA-binding protein [Candidatus Roizmanbacteria bacterium]|nr:ComEA family DNA-binding protein [Candidatus Roizmanbacteria bacterium]
MSPFGEMLLDFIRRRKTELIFITLALVTAFGSLWLFIATAKTTRAQNPPVNDRPRIFSQTPHSNAVEVAGAVVKPGVYDLKFGARLQDVINLAGGLTAEADRHFFNRNYNLARFVRDQDKIYIPTTAEISAGLYRESNHNTNYLDGVLLDASSSSPSSTALVNLNAASLEDLAHLPGVGEATAQKIGQGKPYHSVDELLKRKIINKGLYDKIKDQLTVN